MGPCFSNLAAPINGVQRRVVLTDAPGDDEAMLHDGSGNPPPTDEAFAKAMLRMGQLSSHPLLAIYEATEAIASEAGADLVSVSMFTDGQAECSVLLAAYGEGAAVLERNMLVRRGSGDTSSVHWALDVPGGRLSVPNAAVGSKLPADLAQLHYSTGLASFEVLSISNPLGGNLGTLLVGKTAPNGFGRPGERLLPALAAAIASLVPPLRHGCVSAAAQVVRSICQAPDTVAAIKELLSSVTGFMLGQENLPVEPRLALLADGPRSDKMLMFEPLQKALGKERNQRECTLASSRSVLPPKNASKEVAMRELKLKGTLLYKSIVLERASVVYDMSVYIQNTVDPAYDVLMASSGATSLAVVPMMMGGVAIGALYVAPTTRIDFGNIQKTLLGLVSCLTLAIASKLDHGGIMALVGQAGLQSGTSSGGHSHSGLKTSAASTSYGNSSHEMSVAPLTPSIEQSGGCSNEFSRLHVIPQQRLATEAMMKVLQREIRGGRRSSKELSFAADLSIHKEISRGGFGTVYYGKWRNAPAAIKVTNSLTHNGDAVPDAMELAILNSVSHPNVVQLLSCLLNMVVADDASANSAFVCSRSSPQEPLAPGAKPPPRFCHMNPKDLKHRAAPTFNLIVLEYCDRGSLRDAIRSGIFHCRLDAAGRIGVDLASIIEVLLDVATAVQYLHDSANLVHGDLKMDNVLLKSDPNHPRGFTPKLGDFGLSKVLNNDHLDRQVINRTGAGTVTHLAPEMFTAGAPVTPAVDVYAWGILMFEAYTGRRAFSGLSSNIVMEWVLQRNMRPRFPRGTPPAYADLANRCWMHNSEDRPSFVEIVLSLRDMRTAVNPAAAAGAATPGPTPAAANANFATAAAAFAVATASTSL